MYNIKIDDEPYATTKWYSGKYTDEKGEQFEFNLSFENSDNTESIVSSVNWTEAIPEGHEPIEKEIEKQFNS